MSTYTVHSPISRRHGRSNVALSTTTAIAIVACVLAALIALAFVAAAPTTSSTVKHLGHGAVLTATDQAVTTVVASNGTAPVAAAKAPTPVRPWRETLHGRALIVSRSAAPAPSSTAAAGQ